MLGRIAVIVATVALALIGIIETTRPTTAATTAVAQTAPAVSSVSCTNPPSTLSPPPSKAIGTATKENPVECFVSWSDGTRCVSVWGTAGAQPNGGSGAAAALQCAFSPAR
jgi:hypothetical protein